MQIKDLIPWARKDGAPDAKSSEDNPIATLQREMNHVFENFWNRVGQFEWPWGSGEAKSDMVETDNAIEVSIELPGMEMKDIEVTVNDDMLTVKGRRRSSARWRRRGITSPSAATAQSTGQFRSLPVWMAKRRRHPSRTGF